MKIPTFRQEGSVPKRIAARYVTSLQWRVVYEAVSQDRTDVRRVKRRLGATTTIKTDSGRYTRFTGKTSRTAEPSRSADGLINVTKPFPETVFTTLPWAQSMGGSPTRVVVSRCDWNITRTKPLKRTDGLRVVTRHRTPYVYVSATVFDART